MPCCRKGETVCEQSSAGASVRGLARRRMREIIHVEGVVAALPRKSKQWFSVPPVLRRGLHPHCPSRACPAVALRARSCGHAWCPPLGSASQLLVAAATQSGVSSGLPTFSPQQLQVHGADVLLSNALSAEM